MKQILLTIVATIAGLAVAIVWLGALGIVDLAKLQEWLAISISDRSQDQFVAQTVESEPGVWEEATVDGIATILCEGTANPELQPDGSFLCVEAPKVPTQCMGPDGEAYDDGKSLTFYKVAEKTEENKNMKIECESVEKTCTNADFTYQGSSVSDVDAYAHLECKIIDRTNTDEIPCTDDNGYEVPAGSTRVRYLQDRITVDADCVHIEEYCNAAWTWISNFPTHEMVSCTFKWSLTPEFVLDNAEKVLDEKGELKPEALWTIMPDSSKKSCTTPWWKTIAHGEKFISFKEKVVRFTEECFSRTHTCIDGELEFVEPYTFDTCKIEGPDACEIKETSVTVLHDSKKTLYKKWRMVNGVRTCDEQSRYCFDTKLDGDSEYMYPTCTPPGGTAVKWPARCPNPFHGESAVLDHGWSGVGYFKNNVGRLQSCDGEVDGKVNKVNVSCQYGTIQPIGNSQKIRRSCSKGTPSDCTAPWWSTVPHGTSVTAYEVSGVSYGNQCKSESRICNDGVLAGSYQVKSCSVGNPVGCSHACGKVEHGQTITSYSATNLTRGWGQTCSNVQIASTCNNWTLSPRAWDFCSCTVEQPKSCVGPNGESIAHLWYLTLYKDPFVYGLPQDGFDQCERQVRQCVNWVLLRSDGVSEWFTFRNKKCDVIPPTGGAATAGQ
jgi:hypothetical protein